MGTICQYSERTLISFISSGMSTIQYSMLSVNISLMFYVFRFWIPNWYSILNINIMTLD